MSIGFLLKEGDFLKFNTIGIICEYNPFHFGHKYHIGKTKELTGCQNIVCIMSGSMVQRGECAIFNKWQRASAAIQAGVDLVVELPCYYVLQSADIFALGGIKLLNGIGIADGISFGCECGDINILKNIASLTSDDNTIYNKHLKELMKQGLGYPQASQEALYRCKPEYSDVVSKPNNTLGISYLKAIKKTNSKHEAICIKRDNDYHGEFSCDGFASATHIRNMILSGNEYKSYCIDYSECDIHNIKNAESFILGYLRQLDPTTAKITKGYEDGIDNLVIQSSRKACTIEELISICSGKRYTQHRIKRYIMSLILGINYEAEPNYIRVLAMSSKGKALIKRIKETTDFDIIVKTADYKQKNAMFETDIKATDFASLCSSNVNSRNAGMDFTTSPYILK